MTPHRIERAYCRERLSLTLAWRDKVESYRRAIGELRAAQRTGGFYVALDKTQCARSACEAARWDLESHVAEHQCLREPLTEMPCDLLSPR
jgi:hypothetical protein